jgi:NADP-dependent 3-hydroxy acid dehydrogenase YdfG
MRARQEGLFIHIGSWVAHFPSMLAGPVYTATKTAVVAMSHTINMEEGVNGIRSCVLSPGEVVTPLMDKRPVPPTAAERSLMLKPEDIADLAVYLTGLPPHICVNEIVVSPTKSRLHH